ncbi:hypothetical protein [Corynebacterium massiliense]|uniref:Uncharacterized protein n=1 Tax=Corynebacterium massiliense DSM 45435 TaxID=1121364 RepID=A0ABY7U6V1_9CORY|nr:hypothetical protein [Corynebacterium massiliense]WCZ32420.1 hypothetical protein CMASS_04865 [Corynebacterium massiliense DSM 45435]
MNNSTEPTAHVTAHIACPDKSTGRKVITWSGETLDRILAVKLHFSKKDFKTLLSDTDTTVSVCTHCYEALNRKKAEDAKKLKLTGLEWERDFAVDALVDAHRAGDAEAIEHYAKEAIRFEDERNALSASFDNGQGDA